jgi:TonB family protein
MSSARARTVMMILCALSAARTSRAQRGPQGPTAPARTLTRAPTLLRFVQAPYPEAERARGRAAAVVLQLRLNERGGVDEARVVSSAGDAFDQAALTAARAFVFSPAEIDGRPASVSLQYRYEFTLRVETPSTAEFEGVVLRRGTRAPLVGVRVSLEGAGEQVTDAQGRFRFTGVSPGARRVSFAGDRLVDQRVTERFEAGARLQARYELALAPEARAGRDADTDDVELVVRAPPIRRQAVATDISSEQARRVPGTQGDVLRVVESLPGVARAAAGSGALVVWGSAPEDTRILVDGVPIPRLYHDGGIRSVISGELVSRVELLAGAYGPAFGRGLGGVVRVESSALATRGTHASLSLDALDAAASASAAPSDRVAVFAAVRRAHLWRVLDAAGVDTGGFLSVPRYWDAQARVRYAPSARERVELTALASSDFTARAARSADPTREASEQRSLDFFRVYSRYTLRDDGLELEVTPWLGADLSAQRAVTSGVPTGLRATSLRGGVRASLRVRVRPWVTVEAGLDAEASRSELARDGSVALPAREGDLRVFGQPPPDQLNTDRWSVISLGVAPYAEATFSLFGGALELTPGLRADPYARAVNRREPPGLNAPTIGLFSEHFSLEPRMAVRARPHRRLTVRAGYGATGQPPQPEDLSSVFGAPALAAARASQWAVTGQLAITESLSAEVTGFFTESSRLAARSSAASPLRAQALVSTGEGRAYGGQLLVRQNLWRGLFGWIAYAWSRSERRASPEAPWRLFDYDQTHTLTVVLSASLPRGFELGVRGRISSGYPRTPVAGAFYDARRDRYEPLFGAQNGDSLPLFAQLDLRASRRWRIGVSELEVSLDVLNVTAQRNAEEFVYDERFLTREVISGLPILPSLGARWTF